MRDGPRLHLRRRLAVTGAALAVLAASVGAATALSDRGPGPDPATPAPHWMGSATPRDPAAVSVTFGRLPPGMASDGYWGFENATANAANAPASATATRRASAGADAHSSPLPSALT